MDWPEPFVMLDGWSWRAAPEKKPIYGGLLDLSGTLRMGWDECCLYVALAIVDDHFLPAVDNAPIESGDAVVLSFVPSQRETQAIEPRDIVFAFSKNTTMFFRSTARQLQLAGGARIGVARSVLSTPVTPLKHEEDKTDAGFITKLWYEFTIPWTLLPEITPATNNTFGLAVQILDNDGQGVRGRLCWRGAQNAPRLHKDYALIRFMQPLMTPGDAALSDME